MRENLEQTPTPGHRPHSSQHQQTVIQVPVKVISVSGIERQCFAFLHKNSRFGSRPETLLDRLNDEETLFLPFAGDDGVRIVNLLAIALIECQRRAPEADEFLAVGCSRERAEVMMTHGRKITGDLLYGLPNANSRISDLLNTNFEFEYPLDINVFHFRAHRRANGWIAGVDQRHRLRTRNARHQTTVSGQYLSRPVGGRLSF